MPLYLYRCSDCHAVFESSTRVARMACRKAGCQGTAHQVDGFVSYSRPVPNLSATPTS